MTDGKSLRIFGDGRTDRDGSMQSFGNARGFNETTATLAHNLLSHVPSA